LAAAGRTSTETSSRPEEEEVDGEGGGGGPEGESLATLSDGATEKEGEEEERRVSADEITTS